MLVLGFFSSLIQVLLIAWLLHGPAEEGDGFRPVPTLRAGIQSWWWKNFSLGGEGRVDNYLLGTHLAAFLEEFQCGRVAVWHPQELGERISFWKNEQAASWWLTSLLLLSHPFLVTLPLAWPSFTAWAWQPAGIQKHSVLSSAVRQGKEGWAAITFLCLRPTDVWWEWWTEHHPKCTSAPSWNKLWGPWGKTFPAQPWHFPQQCNC